MKTEVEAEIKRREKRGRQLAAKFPELAGLTYEDFIAALFPIMPNIDVVTSSEMYDALNGGRK